jgi:hypothetical protein
MSARKGVPFIVVSWLSFVCLHGQTQPDVLTFKNGEKLIGHLVRTHRKDVTFKSDMAGEVTVDWSKIQELRTGDQFAVIRNGVKLRGQQDAGTVPQGPITATDQNITITPSAGRSPETVPVPDANFVVSEKVFQNTLHRPGILQAWKGTMTGGVSLVEATQNSHTLTSNISLVRTTPTETWVDPRDRTIIDFSSSLGKITQPATPTIKTNIYHADAERDEYLTPRVYAFGLLSYDHNFSQGLDLQQTYGGGIGYTLIANSTSTLDVKGNFDYVRQAFAGATKNQNLIAASVGERYLRNMPRGIVLNEQLAFTPAFNNTSAYSGLGTVGLTVPAYKRLNLSAIMTDAFLNNPPPGFKKNSLQLTIGVSYALP